MKQSRLLTAFLIGWLVCFALSFLAAGTTPPTGDGFTRGLNRLGVFFAWQAVAVVCAIAALTVGWTRLRGNRLWFRLSLLPLCTEILLVLVVVGLSGYSIYKNDTSSVAQNEVPSRPVTQPVAPSEDSANEAPRAVEVFQGIYRSGFEASHFYTMDGRGPWWLLAEGEQWEALRKFYVDGPGRSGGVTAALTLRAWLGDPDPGLDHLGRFEHRIHVVSIDSIRQLSPEEFQQIRAAIQR